MNNFNFPPSRFETFSIRNASWGSSLSRIMSASIQAVEPGTALSRKMRRDGDQLFIEDKSYDLSKINRVKVIGAGKAAYPMAAAAVKILHPHLEQVRVIVKEGHTLPEIPQMLALAGGETDDPGQQTIKVEVFEAGHPIPDENGINATTRLIDLISDSQPDDMVICLISGGGSALLVSPVEGVTLKDIQELTAQLLASGATINEINTLRKHLSLVKGGGLARCASPARVATLILSDVVGDPLDVIASGPTVPDNSTYGDARAVLEKYNLHGIIPGAIARHVERGLSRKIPETPKPGDAVFDRVQNVIIGSNLLACQAALRQAVREGFNSLLLTTWLEGEAVQAGRFLSGILRQIASSSHPVARPACIILGGETTVTLHGDGLGGRNQEMALSAVYDLDGLQDSALITLATDGGDGPTEAAGAVVTGNTLQRARSIGLEPGDFLKRNDAYHFFDQLGDLIKTGPTLTNVNDIAFLVAGNTDGVIPA